MEKEITVDKLYFITASKAKSINAETGLEVRFAYTGNDRFIGISWVNQFLAMFTAEEVEKSEDRIVFKNIYDLKIRVPQFVTRMDIGRYLMVVDEVGKEIFGKDIVLNLE
jgi:hypothetical protein